MTEKVDLDAIQERADKATKGAFEFVRYNHGGGRLWVERKGGGRSLVLDTFHAGDTEFYQHAQRDIPTLLELVKAWKGVLEYIDEDTTYLDSAKNVARVALARLSEKGE